VPSLFVIQGHNRGTRYELTDGEGAVTIGREAGNVVRLDDNEVSRRHAEIRRVGDRFVVGDLKSSNGTYVNSRKVDREELSVGDRIQVGRTVILYAADGDAFDSSLLGTVDIVSPSAAENSRIVRAIPNDESVADVVPADAQLHWLAKARSNVQVMYRTSLAVSHTLDIDELLGRILELVFEWIEADRGCIMLIDPETKQLRTKARRDRQVGEATSMTISRTILDYVLDRREGVLTSDAQDDDRFSAGNSVVRTGIREAICVPLQGRYDIVGVIYVDTLVPLVESVESGPRFTDEHLKLLIAIGHQAALAVEDTTYYSAMVQSERLAAVGQAIATVSHHIKNILQGIRGGSYLVEMGLDNEDMAVLQKGWDIVRRNQNKISSLVMDMLSFSKEREPDPVPSDLGAVIDDVVETVQQRADEAGVTVRWEKPADLPRLVFDPEALSRAVLNVVSNALDALEERAAPRVEIDVACDTDAGVVRITVADNGAGMDPETLATIFNLFVSTKGSRGTGLGLTVTRKILREHGGDITATSELGKGSTFVMEFPLRLESDFDPASLAPPESA